MRIKNNLAQKIGNKKQFLCKARGLYRILHIFLSIVILAHTVIPAKAGIQGTLIPVNMLVPGNVISRFRGNDRAFSAVG